MERVLQTSKGKCSKLVIREVCTRMEPQPDSEQATCNNRMRVNTKA